MELRRREEKRRYAAVRVDILPLDNAEAHCLDTSYTRPHSHWVYFYMPDISKHLVSVYSHSTCLSSTIYISCSIPGLWYIPGYIQFTAKKIAYWTPQPYYTGKSESMRELKSHGTNLDLGVWKWWVNVPSFSSSGNFEDVLQGSSEDSQQDRLPGVISLLIGLICLSLLPWLTFPSSPISPL